MTPGNKYILMLSLSAGLALSLLIFLANTDPNMEMILINKSGQSISSIDLKTETAGNNIRIHGVDQGTKVVVKLQTDGGDSVSTFIRFADGKEMRGENIPIEPEIKIIQSIMDEKIIVGSNTSLPEAK
jgi:hypothetical protein